MRARNGFAQAWLMEGANGRIANGSLFLSLLATRHSPRQGLASPDVVGESNDAEASGPHPLCLFAHRQTAALRLARRKAAGLLYRAQYRAFRIRHRARDGSVQPQRTADDAQFRLARLRQPYRQLAAVRDAG